MMIRHQGGDYMIKPAMKICSAAVAAIFILGSCSKDSDRKVEVPAAGSTSASTAYTGEQLFKKFCFNCHPDGNNVSDPKRTLHSAVLKKNHINTTEDIIRIMRNPGPRMLRFDADTLSDSDAQKIAAYVMAAFK